MDQALERTLAGLMERYRVPGAAVSVLRDGKLVFRACLGTVSVARPAPVREDSLFDIGSISKVFNAVALGMLVDEGRLSFDDRVEDLWPGFRLSDASLSPHVTLRDLLGQSVGFGEDSITNYVSRFSRAELAAQLRYLPLRAGFRAECAYQQHGPLLAAAILERVTGMAWEDFVERRICAKLGLGDTWASYTRLADKGRACDPHMDLGDGAMSAVPHRNFDNLAPTGAMVSSLRDMEAWWSGLAAGLGGVLRPQTLAAMLAPGVPVRRDGLHPQRWASRSEANFVSYGIGFFLHDFAGRLVAEHTGALEGFLVLGCAVPRERLAVVVLTNQHGCPALPAMRYHLLAHGLGLPQQDFDARYRAVAEGLGPGPRMVGGEPYFWRPLARVPGAGPSRDLAAYAGAYAHPGLGAVTVRLGADGLAADLLGTDCRLAHWHDDVFHAVPEDRALRVVRPDLFLRFGADAAGRIARLALPGIVGDFARLFD
jgi:CubicO group peptidase (beta-lactamase class C family)